MRILNRDDIGSHGNTAGRSAVVEILEAGLRAADPYTNTLRLLRVEGGRLIVGNRDFEPSGDPRSGDAVFDLSRVGRIFVVGAAKGVQYVAKAIEDVLGDRLTGGHVIAKHGDEPILSRIEVTYGAHPVPDDGCVEGCRRILRLCQDLRADDLVFTIVGNGVSALLTLPVPGVSLEDVRRITYEMQIERGAPTEDLNPVRNHLDVLKGGRISRHIQPAAAVHIMAFDPNGVEGDFDDSYYRLMRRNLFLHTLPEGTTFADAVAMLKRWDLWDSAPAGIREHLEMGDPAWETVKPEEFERGRFRVFGVMPNRQGMLPTAGRKARELGFTPHAMATFLRAEASQAAFTLMDVALTVERHGTPFDPPCALLTSGELLVTVGKERGVGGRNQEFALAAALRISGSRTVVVGAVDSDGTDGPGTQFNHGAGAAACLAGGLVDGNSALRAVEEGIDIHSVLKRHDSSAALRLMGDGIMASHNISMGDLGVILITGRG